MSPNSEILHHTASPAHSPVTWISRSTLDFLWPNPQQQRVFSLLFLIMVLLMVEPIPAAAYLSEYSSADRANGSSSSPACKPGLISSNLLPFSTFFTSLPSVLTFYTITGNSTIYWPNATSPQPSILTCQFNLLLL